MVTSSGRVRSIGFLPEHAAEIARIGGVPLDPSEHVLRDRAG